MGPTIFLSRPCVCHWLETYRCRRLTPALIEYIYLERELLTSNTLVKLTLSGGISLEVDHVYFPALKSLSLISVSGLGCPDYCDLLDGSPVLGDLYICDDAYPYNPPCCSTIMMSKSIKRLVVFTHLPDSQEYHDAMLFSVLLSLKTMSVLLWICSSKPGSISSYGRSQLAIMIILMMMMMIIFMMINQRCLSLVMLQTKLVAGTTNITTLYLSADSLEVCFLATCY